VQALRAASGAGVGERKRVNGEERWHGFGLSLSLPSFSRGVLSSKHCGPVWRQAQLTDAIWLSSAAVVENYDAAPRLLPYAMKSCAPSACAARP
jgi:hypothetical protein